MPPDEGPMSQPDNLGWRVQQLEANDKDRERKLDEIVGTVAKHELDIHSERGLYRWMESMERRLGWVNRALWAIALAIIGSAVAIVLAGGGHP
jgi:hypothetical protein